jgi:hypothetical protein
MLTNTTNVVLQGNAATDVASVSVYTTALPMPIAANLALDGSWTVDVSSLVTSGDNTFTVTVATTDLAGNTSTTFTNVMVDTIAPESSTVALQAADQGLDPRVTSVARPTLVGEFNAEDEVTVRLDDVEIATAGNHWSIAPSADLANGLHTVSVITSDEAGNTTATSMTFTVDTMTHTATTDPVEYDNGNYTVYSESNKVFLVVGGDSIEGTSDGAGHWTFTDPNSGTPGTKTTYTAEINQNGDLVFGKPTSVNSGAITTYRTLPDADTEADDFSALTLDYSNLAEPSVVGDATEFKVSELDVLDYGANAAIDLTAVTENQATPEGETADAGRQTAEGIFNPTPADFGFGADGMLTANNPYLHQLEHGGWQSI